MLCSRMLSSKHTNINTNKNKSVSFLARLEGVDKFWRDGATSSISSAPVNMALTVKSYHPALHVKPTRRTVMHSECIDLHVAHSFYVSVPCPTHSSVNRHQKNLSNYPKSLYHYTQNCSRKCFHDTRKEKRVIANCCNPWSY